VLVGVDNILIERWVIIVKSILGNVVILGFGLWGSHDELVFVHLLRNIETVHGSSHVWVFTEGRNWVIHWWSSWWSWMGKLTTSRG